MELTSVAFIPDGNRRFARVQGLNLFQAYLAGTGKAWQVLEWLSNYPKIKNGIFYTLSLENVQRAKTEVHVLFKIFEKELDKIKNNSFIESNGIRLKFVGKKNVFPKKIQEKIFQAENLTENNDKKTIFLALGYDGQQEIVDAAKKIAIESKNGFSIENLDRTVFKKFLYSDLPEPDLIIRTSGTKRLSGFLTYQSAYSEFCFIEKCWPELEKQDLINALSEFEQRQRRFGK